MRLFYSAGDDPLHPRRLKTRFANARIHVGAGRFGTAEGDDSRCQKLDTGAVGSLS